MRKNALFLAEYLNKAAGKKMKQLLKATKEYDSARTDNK